MIFLSYGDGAILVDASRRALASGGTVYSNAAALGDRHDPVRDQRAGARYPSNELLTRASPGQPLPLLLNNLGVQVAMLHLLLRVLCGSGAPSRPVRSLLTSTDEVARVPFLGRPDATTLPQRIWEDALELDPTLTAVATLPISLPLLVLPLAELGRSHRSATKAKES